MQFTCPVSKKYGIIFKFAEEEIQRAIPGLDLSKETRLASFDGVLNNQPYWKCGHCGEPVVDEDGIPISVESDFPAIFTTEVQEEQERGQLISGSEINNLQAEQQKTIELCRQEAETQYEIINREIIKFNEKLDTLSFNYYTISQEIESIRKEIAYIFEVFQYHLSNFYQLVKNIVASEYSYLMAPKEKKDIKISVNDTQESLASYVLSNILERLKNLKNEIDLLSRIKNEIQDEFCPYPSYTFNNEAVKRPIDTLATKNIKLYAEDSLKGINILISQFILILKDNANLTKVKNNKFNIKRPICWTCFDQEGYVCYEADCNFRTLDENEVLEVTVKREFDPQTGKRKPKFDAYFCEEHAFRCYSCGETYLNDDDEHNKITEGRYDYCAECYYEIYASCDECHRTFDREDAQYDDDGNTLCPRCYQEEQGTDEDLSKHEEKEAHSFSKELSKNTFYPLDEKTLEKSLLPTLQLAEKRKFNDANQLLEFLVKRLQSKEAIAAIKSKLKHSKYTDAESILDDLISNFDAQLKEVKRYKEEYPNLSGFKLLPVVLKVEGGRGHDGTVFVIYPSNEFLSYADSLVPGAKATYNNFLIRRGHHSGALAYARFSVSEGVIVIDNLQTDIDAQTFEDEDYEIYPGLKWWVSTAKKFWAPYLLDALKQFGERINKEIYLTSFEMQQAKWSHIPERNKDVYDRLPEDMGMPEVRIKLKPESLRNSIYRMRRIAEFLNLNAELFVKLAEKL